MIEVVRNFIARYSQSGVVIDTNLLLLYFLGRFAPEQITRFKRTDTFVLADYKLLELLVRKFSRVWTTPSILTEVNNLSRQLAEPLRTRYFERLRIEISLLNETYVRSNDAVAEGGFVKFGLTDAGIAVLAKAPYLVLTGDFPLYRYLASRGIDAINFNQLRPYAWTEFR